MHYSCKQFELSYNRYIRFYFEVSKSWNFKLQLKISNDAQFF